MMRSRSAGSEMRVFASARPGIIGHEMFIALTEQIPQWMNNPRPASGYHCASGCWVCDESRFTSPRPISECSAWTVSASRELARDFGLATLRLVFASASAGAADCPELQASTPIVAAIHNQWRIRVGRIWVVVESPVIVNY